MLLASVVYILLTVVLGISIADDETKVTIEHLDPDKGTEGYDLFYYDGESLRDEKWRFDPKTGSTVVSRRNGFREMDNFHLVDATLDALGSFTKSYRMKNEKDLIEHRVKEPYTSKEVGDNNMNEAVRSSNAFSGVSINTQYITQNGNSHVSNIVGIQQPYPADLYNGLNFQQAFTTPGFGFQQQGSLFNHQAPHFSSNLSPFIPNNHNFQISTFLMPFFNQHHNSPNQHQPLGSFPAFGIGNGQEMGQSQVAVTEPQHFQTTETSNYSPNTPQVTELPAIQSTLAPIVKTTQDPTLSFDIRAVQDKNVETNVSDTPNIQTTSRRTIEGLPTSDEDDDSGGILDDKINTQVLKTLVG